MSIHKLTSTNAFVAFDLEGAPAAGIVRAAPKILQGGAKDLARSLTYAFAILEMKRSGASAGINAQPDEQAEAIANFATELTPMASDGQLAIDAGKGVAEADLASLHEVDGRSSVAAAAHDGDDLATHLAGLGPVFAAAAAIGGLDGKRVVIEGFGEHGAALAEAAVAQGASVIAFSTTKGAAMNRDGFDPAGLRAQWTDSRDAMVGDDAEPAWKVFGADADVLFTGSKMGAINHETAAKLTVGAVVPHAPIPYTARALAVMQRADIFAVPDFVATAGPLLAKWPTGDATPEAVVAAASEAIASAMSDAAGHPDGAFLGACARAEAFLGSWRDELPFGRPLAS